MSFWYLKLIFSKNVRYYGFWLNVRETKIFLKMELIFDFMVGKTFKVNLCKISSLTF